MNKPIKAWHFLHTGNKLRNGTTAPPDGVTLKFNGQPIMCQQGLHASIDPYDALYHAPGPILCLVECGGIILHEKDKLVCTERTIIQRIDSTDLCRYYVRMQALEATKFWTPPDIVLEYLVTGNESIRAAAGAAVWAAARASAWAAWAAARATAGDAVWAAWAATRATAGDATRATAGDAVWAARDAARASAWAAARATAGDATRAAVWASARATARAAARAEFSALVHESFEGVV